MKLIIQIPCFNEAATLAETVRDLPSRIEGIDEIEILVIDDGSEDGTSEVAEREGVDYIVRLSRNTGLAHAFAVGLEESLKRGADIIVNTDADHQYQGSYIADLVEPILAGHADLVVGDRQVKSIRHFSRAKRLLQRIGSWVVRWASSTGIPDAASGFRAMTREAALQLNVFSNYTYTLETVIQAGRRGMQVTSVPIQTNQVLRESRLIRSTADYILRSTGTILRIFLMYQALRVFITLGAVPVAVGMFFVIRFGYFYLLGEGSGHVQSLVVASILIVLGFLTGLLGLLADLIARNRSLQEENLYYSRKASLLRQVNRSEMARSEAAPAKK